MQKVRSMARFKGRVIGIEGSRITIDTKAETREIVNPITKERKTIASAWEKPEFPKIGAVVRCNFHRRDLQ